MLQWILDFVSVLLNSAPYGKHVRSVVKNRNVIKAERKEVAERWSVNLTQQVTAAHQLHLQSAGLDESGFDLHSGVAAKKPSVCQFNSVGFSPLCLSSV